MHGNQAELVESKQVVPQGYEPGIRERILSANEIRELRDIFASMATTYEAAKDKRVADRPVLRETQSLCGSVSGPATVLANCSKPAWST